MSKRDRNTEQELARLLQELDGISQDLSTYLSYQENRQTIINDMLGCSTLN